MKNGCCRFFCGRSMGCSTGSTARRRTIFVDGSSDAQFPSSARQGARPDSAIATSGCSRNFGHQIAITTGMDRASGDASS